MTRHPFVSFAVFALTLCGCYAVPVVNTPDSPMEMIRVVNEMEKAGNPDKIDIKTLRISYKGMIALNGITMDMVSCFKAPDKLRNEVTVPGMPKTINVFDGVNGWNCTVGMGTKPISGRELDFFRIQVKMANPENRLTDVFPQVTLDKNKASVDGVSCYRIVATPPNDITIPPIELFVDSQTYLTRKLVMIAPTAMGDIPCTTTTGDYRKIGGIMVPGSQRTQMLGMDVAATLIKCEVNPPLADSLFTQPEDN
ncbi:MAG: hypothetical protein AB7F32_04880 [Victivallaceae bacterium]